MDSIDDQIASLTNSSISTDFDSYFDNVTTSGSQDVNGEGVDLSVLSQQVQDLLRKSKLISKGTYSSCKRLLKRFFFHAPYLLHIVPASCEEYKKFGFTESGVLEIDPDGLGNGQGPFEVFCKLDQGETMI